MLVQFRLDTPVPCALGSHPAAGALLRDADRRHPWHGGWPTEIAARPPKANPYQSINLNWSG